MHSLAPQYWILVYKLKLKVALVLRCVGCAQLRGEGTSLMIFDYCDGKGRRVGEGRQQGLEDKDLSLGCSGW